MSDHVVDESFAEIRRVIEHPELYPPRFVSMDIELVPKILTAGRVRLINELARHGPADSVEELARRLGRNYASVSRDISHLVGGLVETTQNGHRKSIRATGWPIMITGPLHEEVVG